MSILLPPMRRVSVAVNPANQTRLASAAAANAAHAINSVGQRSTDGARGSRQAPKGRNPSWAWHLKKRD
ncbi:MAG: hypothetical protein LBJ57_01170 [Prevotellaceae bacterium]|nr:hypothetical protein [Prevotellaceae bacterium]